MKESTIQDIRTRALALLKANRFNEARELFRNICDTDYQDDESWYLLGGINVYLGNYVESESCYRHVVNMKPERADAHDNLGAVLQQLGKHGEALQYHLHALKLNSNFHPAYYHIGNIYRAQGDRLKAEKYYLKALNINPKFTAAVNNLSYVLLEQNRYYEVLDILEPFNKSGWMDPILALILGRAFYGIGRFESAQQAFDRVIHLKSDDAVAHFYLGELMRVKSDWLEAEKNYRNAIYYNPGLYQAKGQLAAVLDKQGKRDEAITILQELLDNRPASTQARALLSAIYEHRGNYQEAKNCLKPLLGVKSDIDPNVALVFGRISHNPGDQEEAIKLLENALIKNIENNETEIQMHFTLAKLYDRVGVYQKAYKHFTIGNNLTICSYDKNQAITDIQNTIEVYTREFMQNAPRSTVMTERPIFIVGMPRSGTSLVEQILTSHPDIAGAGELRTIQSLVFSLTDHMNTGCVYPYWMRTIDQIALNRMAEIYIRELNTLSADAKRITDKMPHNFLHLGFIDLLLPRSRIIHCVRDARDTCLSCYFQNFGRRHLYSTDLRLLGKYYKSYRKLMDHWLEVIKLPLLEIRYEDLVTCQENTSRTLLDFCGLDWNKRCLKFYETERVVKTASYEQVRHPIYSSSVGRWKKYEQYINPLIDILGNE